MTIGYADGSGSASKPRRFAGRHVQVGELLINADTKMLGDTDHARVDAPRRMSDVVVVFHFEPESELRTLITNEIAVLIGPLLDAKERALQALRNVRHLLPTEGVAIVDEILDHAT